MRNRGRFYTATRYSDRQLWAWVKGKKRFLQKWPDRERPDSLQYDFFLSHNQANKPRVRRLTERLRAAGLHVWFDEWVIRPGDDIYLVIEAGLEASRKLVLCLYPANRLGHSRFVSHR